MTAHVIPVDALEDEDGMFTPKGMSLVGRYAQHWLDTGERDLEIEREAPSMADVFYDVRADVDVANRYAPRPRWVKSLTAALTPVTYVIAG